MGKAKYISTIHFEKIDYEYYMTKTGRFYIRKKENKTISNWMRCKRNFIADLEKERNVFWSNRGEA